MSKIKVDTELLKEDVMVIKNKLSDLKSCGKLFKERKASGYDMKSTREYYNAAGEIAEAVEEFAKSVELSIMAVLDEAGILEEVDSDLAKLNGKLVD